MMRRQLLQYVHIARDQMVLGYNANRITKFGEDLQATAGQL
jgi:hypothetical protein